MAKLAKSLKSELTVIPSNNEDKLDFLPKDEDLLPSGENYDFVESLWSNYQELKPLQQRALSLLISGESISNVAKTLGVERHTIYAWLQDELFSECYQKWQKRLLIDTYHLQKQVYQKALKSLDIMLNNPQNLEQYFEVVKFVISTLKP